MFTRTRKATPPVECPSSLAEGSFWARAIAAPSGTQVRGVEEEADLAVAHAVRASESHALRKFYRATGGSRWWYRHSGWSASGRDAPQYRLDEFEGVTVGPAGCTDQVRLEGNRLRTSRMREGTGAS